MKFWSRCALIGCMILFLITMVACSTTELEERSFPMLVAVNIENGKIRYTDAFPKEDSTGSLGAKEKDYSHLKALVLDEEVLEDRKAYGNVMEKIAQEEKLPRNAYVCVMEDAEDLFAIEHLLSQDLGTYLEEYLKSHEVNKGRLITLGDLLDEYVNETMILYLPYLEVEENMLQWQGYMNNLGKIWQES